MSSKNVLVTKIAQETIDGVATKENDAGTARVVAEAMLVHHAFIFGGIGPAHIARELAVDGTRPALVFGDLEETFQAGRIAGAQHVHTVVWAAVVSGKAAVRAEDFLVDGGGEGKVGEDAVALEPDFFAEH